MLVDRLAPSGIAVEIFRSYYSHPFRPRGRRRHCSRGVPLVSETSVPPLRLCRWADAGYNFRIELLLRSVTTTLTGEAMFSALDGVESAAFQNGLKTTVQHIDRLLNLIGSRLGLDHDRVLGGRKETNLRVSAKDPRAYFAAYAEKDPAFPSSHRWHRTHPGNRHLSEPFPSIRT